MSGGQQIGVSQGTLVFNRSGLGISVLQGTLTASGNAVTASLSGLQIDLALSSLLIGGTSISGQAISPAAGTLSAGRSIQLNGISVSCLTGIPVGDIGAVDTFITSTTGPVGPYFERSLIGQSVSVGHGSILFSQDDLIGQGATFSTGNTLQNRFVALSGLQITSAYGEVTPSGGTQPVDDVRIGGIRILPPVRRRYETDDEKLQRRIRQGTIKPKTLEAPKHNLTADELKADAERIKELIARLQKERAPILKRILSLEAKGDDDAAHKLTLAKQADQIAEAKERLLREELELNEVLMVARAAMDEL